MEEDIIDCLTETLMKDAQLVTHIRSLVARRLSVESLSDRPYCKSLVDSAVNDTFEALQLNDLVKSTKKMKNTFVLYISVCRTVREMKNESDG